MKRNQMKLGICAMALTLAAIVGCDAKDNKEHSSDAAGNTTKPETTIAASVETTKEQTTQAPKESQTASANEVPTESESETMKETIEVMYKQNASDVAAKAAKLFENMDLTKTLKSLTQNNPIMTQRLGADPYVIVYDDTVYVYMTGDVVEREVGGKVKNNSYSKIRSLCVVSSKDLVNWTDHGTIFAAGAQGASKWGNNSWAPAVCYKEVNGQMKFFIYFANGGNGIGVLESDSPTGPFVDPIGKALISRQTPNCGNVTWLFDPAVLVDDDNRAYLYFGGGVPSGKEADPGTGRVVELGDDMISIKGEPQALDIPYLFEDSGINKIGDTYYYSYCSNWNVTKEAEKELGFASAQIVYMTSDSPMGPFTLQGPVLKNPGNYFGCYGNNHHCMFELDGKYYIAYHSQILEKLMNISGGYRCTHIDEITVDENGKIPMNTGTKTGVAQRGTFLPYGIIQAETMATMGGIDTTQYGEQSETYGSGNMIVTGINEGDWIALKGVDFGEEGAATFTASIRSNTSQGYIKICVDELNGDAIGYLQLGATGKDTFENYETTLIKTVTGVHDLYFVFAGEGYEIDTWGFEKK